MFTEKLKALRESKGLNKREMSDILKMPYTTYNNYETGARDPSSDVLIKIANRFNVSTDYLLGNASLTIPAGFASIPQMRKVPLVGSIACGVPILAEENIEGYVNMPENVHADFSLRCKGDSMIDARINDGDIVFIRKQPNVENGEIAAVRIGEEATLKRVYIQSSTVTLMACNPKYPPMIYSGEEIENIAIEGKAVAFLSGVE